MEQLNQYTIPQLKQALKWAKKGGKFDSLREDVPDAAQWWVSQRVERVAANFKQQRMDWGRWQRMRYGREPKEPEMSLSDMDQSFRDELVALLLDHFKRIEGYYREKKETGIENGGLSGRIQYSKQECQAAHDFIASGRVPERMSDMPQVLQDSIWRSLEVPTRHLEKKAASAQFISSGTYPMSRTEKDIDAECIEAVTSGLPDFIRGLRKQIQYSRRQKRAGG